VDPVQSVPPFDAGVATDRVWERVPPPQRTLHPVHELHEPQTQLMGVEQDWVLQFSVIVFPVGEHGVPPLEAALVTVRVAVRVPKNGE
jgi:hypothetical protein